MEIAWEWQQALYAFLPVLTRLTAFWTVLPVMRRGVPNLAKVGFAALFAIILLPGVSAPPAPTSWAVFGVQLIGEGLVGLALGFMVSLVFSSLYLAGQLIDVPMGFGMVSLFDPHSGDHVPMLAQFQNALAVLLFFTLNGHHTVLAAISKSFAIVPIGHGQISAGVLQVVFGAFVGLFTLSLRIALPIMAAVFLTDVALGIITRAVPQMNVFVIGFPVKIAVGLLVYLFTLPMIVGIIAHLVGPSGDMVTYLQALVLRLGEAP